MRPLSRITAKLIGIKFKHCSPHRSEGMDCFRLCIEYLRMCGAEIPEDTIYNGYGIFDYKKIYKEDPFKTMELARDFIASMTKEIKIGYEIAGDILVMHTKKMTNLPLHIGIDAGNGQVIIAVRNESVKIVDKKYFHIEKVLRWDQRQLVL